MHLWIVQPGRTSQFRFRLFYFGTLRPICKEKSQNGYGSLLYIESYEVWFEADGPLLWGASPEPTSFPSANCAVEWLWLGIWMNPGIILSAWEWGVSIIADERYDGWPLFDVITGYPPYSILVRHRRNGFDSGFPVLERGVELNDDIFAIGRSGQGSGVGCALQLP